MARGHFDKWEGGWQAGKENLMRLDWVGVLESIGGKTPNSDIGKSFRGGSCRCWMFYFNMGLKMLQ